MRKIRVEFYCHVELYRDSCPRRGKCLYGAAMTGAEMDICDYLEVVAVKPPKGV